MVIRPDHDTYVKNLKIKEKADRQEIKEMTKEMDSIYRKKLEEVIKVGYLILKNGGTSQEAVEKSINLMEDSSLFNAGKGAVLNSNGEIELDASFMDGKTLNAGAIVGVKTIKKNRD